MEFWLWVAVGILALIIAALAAKIHLLKRSAREIRAGFAERCAADTNTLIDLSSGDPDMRGLADSINRQLCLLREERHRYRQGDQELKNAVANISHDLRTPLTAACAYLDLLEREQTSETVRRYLNQIRSRTDALTDLTEELFRYSLAVLSPELAPERINLVTALEDSLLSFYGMLQERGIRPQLALPEAPVWRRLDPAALGRVFSNIIGNTLKYTDGDLSVCMETDGSILFANTARNLDPVAVGRLFDRFYTVRASRDSTGLGLSIARQLTERMGGRIGADYSGGKLLITLQFDA